MIYIYIRMRIIWFRWWWDKDESQWLLYMNIEMFMNLKNLWRNLVKDLKKIHQKAILGILKIVMDGKEASYFWYSQWFKLSMIFEP